ncbi:uncharacterized protein LOC128741840 [Sabethes cyaneus]|uniref:uncharacterized protein LOC128741840 n=1 Tax=Sabethes cyaneus TaxID=53552 RepID=UPI00237E2D55|nr:uncharacterized protein LOC128741840 [Sabethes cyaneus]
MELQNILRAHESNRLDEFISAKGMVTIEGCWDDLIQCTYERKQNLVKTLIEKGIDCDLRNDKNLTPTEHALALGDRKLVRLMLDAEANRFPQIQRMVYRLIRRGSAELLTIFFELKQTKEIDKFTSISYAMEELHVKRVPLKPEMEVYCLKNQLLVCYSSTDRAVPNEDQRIISIRERLGIILREITFLTGNLENDLVDVESLLALDIISDNLYIIDVLWPKEGLRRLGPRWMWDKLHTREIVYCIYVFNKVQNKIRKCLFEYCVLLVDNQFILAILKMLSVELTALKTTKERHRIEGLTLEEDLLQFIRRNDIYAAWKRKYPEKITPTIVKQKRKGKNCAPKLTVKQFNYLQFLLSNVYSIGQIQEQWTKLHPTVRLSKKAILWAIETVRYGQRTRTKPFSEFMPPKSRRVIKLLVRRYQVLKTNFSLEKMILTVDVMKDLHLTEEYVNRVGFAAFRGALQLIGEYSKGTAETPNLEGRLHSQLTGLNSRMINKMYEQQRNIYSHGLSLAEINFRKRCDRGELSNVRLAYCRAVQKDLRKSGDQFRSVYEWVFTKALRACCSRVMCFKSVQQCHAYYGLACELLPATIKGVNGCFPFTEIHILLERLRYYEHLTEVRFLLRAIEQHIKNAQEEDHKHRTRILQYQNRMVSTIKSFAVSKNLETMRRIFIHYDTNHSWNYYSTEAVKQLREANKKVVQVIQLKISLEVNEILFELNSCLARKEDRRNDLNKFKIYQFVPYEDELYTEKLLAGLNIHLEMKKFYRIHSELNRRVYNPASSRNEAGLFDVKKKLKILKKVLNEQSISFETSAVDRLQKTETRKFQLLFEERIQALYDLVNTKPLPDEKLEATRCLAIKMGLLEICGILSHTKAFQLQLEYLNSPAPMPVGKLFRNILAHDVAVGGSSVICPVETTNVTVQVLFELRYEILNTDRKYAALPIFGPCAQKYERRKRYLREQKLPAVKDVKNFLKQCDPQFDIYGFFRLSWPGSQYALHSVLDVLIYNYPDEAIAFVEEHLHAKPHICTSNELFIFYHLWKRLKYSELLGCYPERLVQLFSLLGYTCAFEYESIALKDSLSNRMPQKGFKDDGYDPIDQIEKMLHFCMLTGKFDKFTTFFNCYGKCFDFLSKSNFSHPHFIKQLHKILPWESVDDSGRNLLHMLCSANNVDAIRDALKNKDAKRLTNKKCLDGLNPLQLAAMQGFFDVVEIFLTHNKSTSEDQITLNMVISCHRNDLLYHFTPQFKNGSSLTKVKYIIGSSGNIDALRYLMKIISPKAFQSMIQSTADESLLSFLITFSTKTCVVSEFLAIPAISQTIIKSTGTNPLCLVIGRGRFKNVGLLLKHGAVVTFEVIRASVLSNSYRQTKKLYKETKMTLSNSELISLITMIITENIDEKILKFFVKMLTTQEVPYQWLEIAIQRHVYKYIIFLCETFPSMLQNYQQNAQAQPLVVALRMTERWDSFAKDKSIIKYLMERTSDLTVILLEAVRICDLDIIRYLLESKSAPLESIREGFTALAHVAYLYTTQRQKYSDDVLKMLLERGADVQFLLDHKPEYLGNLHLMEMILEYTAFDPCKAHPKVSFLHNACATGSLRLVKLLVERYKVNIKQTHYTLISPHIMDALPLMVCALNDSFEVMRYLMPRIKDPGHIETSIVRAIAAGKVEAIKLLLQHCPLYKTVQPLNVITVMAYDLKQLHVFIYLHSILLRTIETR